MDNRKKIIFSCYDDLKNPFYGGGGAYAIHEIAKRLAKKHDVKVLTGNYKGAISEIIDGVNYKRIGVSRSGARSGQLIYQILLPYYVMKEDFDIWFENFTPPFSINFLPLFTKKPVIGIANLLAAKDMSKKYWGIPFHLVEKFGLHFYKNVIVLTKYLKQKLESEYLNMNVFEIPNAVDEKYVTFKVTKKTGDYILYLGRIDIRQKGLDLLLSAYKIVEDKINLKLIIAGDGPVEEINTLKESIAAMNLKNKVMLTGWVAGEKKVKLLKNAAFMVLPSRFEEFGIVVLESFCFETPVISFDLPQLSWIPDEGVIKVECENKNKLAYEMLKMSNDKKSRETMGKKAKKNVFKYRWVASAKLYSNVINKVIDENINYSDFSVSKSETSSSSL